MGKTSEKEIQLTGGLSMRGKRPTLRQKKVIAGMNLNPENWLVAKAPPGELHLVHRYTGTKKVIPA